MRRKEPTDTVGDVSEAATVSGDAPIGASVTKVLPARARDGRLRLFVARALEARGFSPFAASLRAAAYVRAHRVLEEMDTWGGRDLARNARAHEVAQRTAFDIAREAGLDLRGPTRSGPTPTRSRVKPTPSTAPARACDASALDDASAEGAEESSRNVSRESADRPEA